VLGVQLAKGPTLRPPEASGTPPWGQVGMAAGYRIGFATGNQGYGLAVLGADNLPAHHRELVREVVDYVTGLGTPAPIGRLPDVEEDRLGRACWALALYETICRIGPAINTPLHDLGPGSTVHDLFGLANEA